MRNKILLSIFSLAIVGLLAACSTVSAAPLKAGDPTTTPPAQTSSSTNLRTLTVTGTGTIYLTPDLAYVNIGVRTENANVSEALSSNTTQSQQVEGVLKDQGIDPKDIQTTNFSIYPQQKTGPDGKTTSTTYVVNNTVNVTIRNVSKLGSILSAVVSSGANNINSVTFDSSARDQALQDARKAAINDAQQQAQALAQAAGVTLGSIQTIDVTTSTPSPIYGIGGAAFSTTQSSVPISAGQLTIQMTANLTYTIQ